MTLPGVTTFRNPSCVSSVQRQAICAVVGDDNALYGFALEADTSGPIFTSTGVLRLGGTIAGDPSCVFTLDGFATCAALDFGNALVAVRFNPATGEISEFETLGGPQGKPIVDNPSCAPARGGYYQIICAVRGNNNALFGIRFNPLTGFNSGWRNLGGNFVGRPSCVNSGPGVVTCAIRDAQNALVAIRFSPNAGVPSPFQNLGGEFAGDPVCAPALKGYNRVICLVRADDNTLTTIRFEPSTDFNSGYVDLTGSLGTTFTEATCTQPATVPALAEGVTCLAKVAGNNAMAAFIVNP